jgi:hypothetical protein
MLVYGTARKYDRFSSVIVYLAKEKLMKLTHFIELVKNINFIVYDRFNRRIWIHNSKHIQILIIV